MCLVNALHIEGWIFDKLQLMRWNLTTSKKSSLQWTMSYRSLSILFLWQSFRINMLKFNSLMISLIQIPALKTKEGFSRTLE